MHVSTKNAPATFICSKKSDSKRLAHRYKNKLKRDYVKSCLEKYKNDSKKLWREIRQFWPSNKNNNVKVGEVFGATDKAAKADKMNEYFANVGASLSDNIPAPLDNELQLCHQIQKPPVFELTESLKQVTVEKPAKNQLVANGQV